MRNKLALFQGISISRAHWFFNLVLVIGIIVCIDILVERFNVRIDCTPYKRHTFSEQTKELLRSLKYPVKFTVFYESGKRWNYDNLFRLIRSYNSNITYELVDLDRNPGKARLLGVDHYGQTIVEIKGKMEKIRYPTERQILTALLSLTEERPKYIYFSKGHGEHDLTESDKTGYTKIKTALEDEAWEVKDIFIANLDNKVNDRSVLVVAGPKRDFLPSELNKVRRYIESSGSVIFMLEPDSKIPLLISFLNSYGFQLPDEVIVDFDQKLAGGDYLTPYIYPQKDHPITRNLTFSCLFSGVRPVERGRSQYVEFSSLAISSPNSLAVSNLDVRTGHIDLNKGIVRKGPISVGGVIRLEVERSNAEKAREMVICFGDSDFISNSFLEILGNKEIFLNTANWLIREKSLNLKRPRTWNYPYQLLSSKQAAFLFWVAIVIIPAIFLCICIIILIQRKRGNGA